MFVVSLAKISNCKCYFVFKNVFNKNKHNQHKHSTIANNITNTHENERKPQTLQQHTTTLSTSTTLANAVSADTSCQQQTKTA